MSLNFKIYNKNSQKNQNPKGKKIKNLIVPIVSMKYCLKILKMQYITNNLIYQIQI